ncbi:hypothetical protein H1R20_g62, partial [Candolleomyces eurysporus]
MTASNQAYSAISFIACFLVLIPMPWHLEAWNTGTVLYMSWTATSLLNFFINSIIWNGNFKNWAPVWCDISSKLIIGVSFGIPCASLCINRRLYYIASVQTVKNTVRDKYKAIAMDLTIGIVVPMIMMALHYVVQGHRFDIFEDVGCWPSTYNVTLQYALLQAPLLLIPSISAVYAVMSIICFCKRKSAFNGMLASRSSSLTSSRYWRLMSLASLEVVLGLPTTLAFVVISATSKEFPVQPWISWEDTHYDFSNVILIPGVAWRNLPTAYTLELTRWSSVVCALIFFAFFGFAEEARKHYSSAVSTVCGAIGVENPFSGQKTRSFGLSSSFGNSPSGTLNGSGSGGLNWARLKISIPGTGGNASNAALPIYVEKEVIKKRDSLDTLSDFMSVLSSGGQSDFTSMKGKPQGLAPSLSGSSPYHSAVPSRSGSPTNGRPRPNIEIRPEDSFMSPVSEVIRTPESAFPRPVTPSSMREGPSFLEMETPATPSSLANVQNQRQRSDNWV